jgi:hypothetical protein
MTATVVAQCASAYTHKFSGVVDASREEDGAESSLAHFVSISWRRGGAAAVCFSTRARIIIKRPASLFSHLLLHRVYKGGSRAIRFIRVSTRSSF